MLALSFCSPPGDQGLRFPDLIFWKVASQVSHANCTCDGPVNFHPTDVSRSLQTWVLEGIYRSSGVYEPSKDTGSVGSGSRMRYAPTTIFQLLPGFAQYSGYTTLFGLRSPASCAHVWLGVCDPWLGLNTPLLSSEKTNCGRILLKFGTNVTSHFHAPLWSWSSCDPCHGWNPYMSYIYGEFCTEVSQWVGGLLSW